MPNGDIKYPRIYCTYSKLLHVHWYNYTEKTFFNNPKLAKKEIRDIDDNLYEILEEFFINANFRKYYLLIKEHWFNEEGVK